MSLIRALLVLPFLSIAYAQNYGYEIVARSGQVIAGRTLTSPLTAPSLNGSGQVAFSTGGGIFTQSSVVAETGQTIGGKTLTGFFGGPWINGSGQVAFMGTYSGGTGVFINSTLAVGSGQVIGGQTVSSPYPPAVLDNSGVLFTGESSGSSGKVFTATSFVTNGFSARRNSQNKIVYVANGNGRFQTIGLGGVNYGPGSVIDGLSMLDIFSTLGSPSINESSQIAFWGLFSTGGGAVAAIVVNDHIVFRAGQTIGGIAISSVGTLSLNDGGVVASSGSRNDGGSVVYTQNAIVAQQGQSIPGCTLTYVAAPVINNAGQVAFSGNCSDGSSVIVLATPGGAPPVSVSVSPQTASLQPNQTQQFTAAVSNAANTVTWAVASGPGSVNSNGLYTAPASIPSTQTAIVRATSTVDTSKSGDATVTLNPPVVVTVAPSSATLQAGQTQQFTATVTGAANTVAWSVSSGPGSVSASGLYTAPATLAQSQTARVRATSTVDNTRFDEANISLQAISCSYSLSATSATYAPAGGTATVNVVTAAGCPWTAASNDGFITVTGGGSGSGPGIVAYAVSSNAGGLSRSGTLTIAGITYSVSQSGRGCSASLNPSRQAHGPAAATGTIVLSLSFDCPWSATSAVPWVTINAPRSGLGSAVINYSVAANPGPTARSTTLVVGGVSFSLTQAASDCTVISISEAGQSFAAAGGAGQVVVSAPSGCAYTATTNDPFLVVTPGNRTGPSTVSFTVQPNTTRSARTGTLTIAGQAFVVTQAADITPVIVCALANVASPATLRSTGRTELLSDLTVNCSGRSGGVAFAADLLVTLNAAVTNRLTDGSAESVDARLTIAGGGTITGRLEGANSIRFPNVPMSSGEPVVELSMTISKLRADVTQFGSSLDLENRITAGIALLAPLRVTVTNGPQTLGISRPPVTISRGVVGDGPGADQKIVRVVVQEGFANDFRTKDAEAGGSPADYATRLLLRISNVPVNVQVFAPVASVNGNARLMSADPDGIGGAAVAGSARAGGTYAALLIPGGVSTAVWEVVASDPQTIDGAEFPLLFENASLADIDRIRIEAALAPLNGTPVASATAPVPRFADPTSTGGSTDMRIRGKSQTVVADSRLRAPVAIGSSSTFIYQIDNGSDIAADNVVFRGVLAAGLTPTSCVSTQGSCILTGGQMKASLGRFTGGAQATVTVNATVGGLASCPSCVANGNLLTSNATVSSDQADPDVSNNSSAVDVAIDAACQFTVSRPLVTAAGAGSSIKVDVLTGSGCRWTIPPADGGIVILPSGEVQGSATITIAVPANPTSTQRTLSVTVAGQAISVVQAGAGCSFTLTPATGLSAAGGNFQLQVQSSCSWQASGGPDWLHVATPGSGTGNGTVSYSVSPNPTLSPRSGFLEVAGQTVVITQPAGTGTGCVFMLSASSVSVASSGGPATVNVTAASGCAWSATTGDAWIGITSGSAGTGNGSVSLLAVANSGAARTGTVTIAGQSVTVTQAASNGQASPGLRFVSMAPCRVMETRPEYNFQGRTGVFGPPFLPAASTRTLPMTQSGVCQIPASAKAYVLNVTLVPRGGVDFVTIWPGSEARPDFWTVRSPDGQIVANSAIVKAGPGGTIQVYTSNATDLIIDISGYLTDDAAVSNLVYYPLAPCRVIDTRAEYRQPAGPFGPPSLVGGASRRFRFPQTPYCQIPAGAAAYSMTLTAVPKGALQYLTAWPAGASQPNVSSINSPVGRVLANSVILPASSDGSLDVFAFDGTDFLVDINGYFAPDDGVSGLFYFPVTQCRAADTQRSAGVFGGPSLSAEVVRSYPLPSSICGLPVTAKAYAVHATVLPGGAAMPFLTLWPSGQGRPNASILNAFEGQVVTNSAIVPAGTNGSMDAFAFRNTHFVLDIAGYFGR